MDKRLSRRTLLLRGLQIPLSAGALLALSACEGDAETVAGTVCADPADMTSAEASVRRTLSYTELASDTSKVCAGCEFFSAGAGDCGSCVMFDGKPVNPRGHCNSWSADS
ncbi:MAG: high-potential iron-sulfur protein [Congregibacter sp.]|nr:high-potential iron-sulfur protein [Congregibacter sp.]